MGRCVATSYFRRQLLPFPPLPRRHRLWIGHKPIRLTWGNFFGVVDLASETPCCFEAC